MASISLKPEPCVFHTIGHSTRSLDEFLGLLAQHQIQLIADVRRFPGSRKYPQFGQEALARELQDAGLGYRWFEDLGGRRRTSEDSVNTVWRNPSFRGYADYMATPAFHAALDNLIALGTEARVALMCAEAPWWRCHRAMISDALCARGHTVVHILDARHTTPHPMTSPARIVDGRVRYDGTPAAGPMPDR